MLVVPLHHGARAVGLAALDDVGHLRVDLEDKLLAVLVLARPHPDVLQGDDALGHILGRVLEVVQALVVQDEPSSLPAFPVAALKGEEEKSSNSSSTANVKINCHFP